MKALFIYPLMRRLPLGLARLVLVGVMSCESELPAQTNSPAQILVQMDERRQHSISHLSLSDKMKFRSAMGAIQSNPQFIAANSAVTNAATPDAQIEARKTLAKVKLELLEKQDPSLRSAVEKIRSAEASAL